MICHDFVGVVNNSPTFLVCCLISIPGRKDCKFRAIGWSVTPQCRSQGKLSYTPGDLPGFDFQCVAKFRPAFMRVTKKLEIYAVRAGIGISTTVGRFSTGSLGSIKCRNIFGEHVFQWRRNRCPLAAKVLSIASDEARAICFNILAIHVEDSQ